MSEKSGCVVSMQCDVNTFGIGRVIFRLCMSYIHLDGLSRWCWENYCDFSKVSLIVLKINIPKVLWRFSTKIPEMG